jgi:thiol-disulfide isomerase/thioredoxin
MQQRRRALPLTGDDVAASNARRQQSKKKRKSSAAARRQLLLLALGAVVLVLCAGYYIMKRPSANNEKHGTDDDGADVSGERFLETFPSLKTDKQLVALYFGSSWCPICKPVTELLEQNMFSMEETVELIFVSSDRTQEEFDKMPDGWKSVPWQSEEATLLKRHYGVCAATEVDSLQVKRRHEIPTLILLDATTPNYEVLTFKGVDDLKKEQEAAEETWLELKQMSDTMKERVAASSDSAEGEGDDSDDQTK